MESQIALVPDGSGNIDADAALAALASFRESHPAYVAWEAGLRAGVRRSAQMNPRDVIVIDSCAFAACDTPVGLVKTRPEPEKPKPQLSKIAKALGSRVAVA